MKLFINDIPSDLCVVGDIAIDTEAMGLNILRDRLCLVQICDEKGEVSLVHFPQSNFQYECPNLIKLLTDPHRQKIFHFARFDVAIIKHYLGIEEIPNIYCTKIASRFFRTYTDSHGLRTLIMELLKVEIKKDQQCSNWGKDVLSEDQKRYAANDVIYLHRIRDELNKMFEANSERKALVYSYFAFINTVTSADIAGFHDDMLSHGYKQ